MKLLKYITYYIIIVFLAILLGTIGWTFLFIVNTILHFLWIGHEGSGGILLENKAFIFPFVLAGSLFLAFIFQKFTVIPKKGVEYAKEYEKNKKVDYSSLLHIYFLAMVPLFLGASVGPEAALVGIFFMLSSLVSDITFVVEKMLGIKIETYEEEVFIKRLKQNKLYLIKILIFYVVTGFVLIYLSGQDSFEPFYVRIRIIDVKIIDFIAIIPLLLVGHLFGKFFIKSGKVIDKVFEKIKNIYLKTFITGTIISFFAMFIPVLILSGEATLHILVDNPFIYTGVGFIFLAVLKVMFTHICISGKIRGGEIFPVVFSAFLLGTGISIVLGINISFCIIAITVGCFLVIFSNTLAIFLFLALFFPFKILSVVLVVAIIFRERIAAGSDGKL